MSPQLLDSVLLRTDFPELKLHASGKVRDVYQLDAEHLLFIATDRISAFDYVLATGIPHKGRVLTQISLFWFDFLRDVVANHVVTADVKQYPAIAQKYADQLQGRSMLVMRAEMIPVECVVRGYISGSAWKEYKTSGRVCGIDLPAGLKESSKLQLTRFFKSRGQFYSANAATGFVFFPRRSGNISSHHALYWNHLGAHDQHRPALQLVGILLRDCRILFHVGGDHVVGDDVA